MTSSFSEESHLCFEAIEQLLWAFFEVEVLFDEHAFGAVADETQAGLIREHDAGQSLCEVQRTEKAAN